MVFFRTFWTFKQGVPHIFFSLFIFIIPQKPLFFHCRTTQRGARCFTIITLSSKVNKRIPLQIYYRKVLVFVFDVTLFKHFLNYELIFYSSLIFIVFFVPIFVYFTKYYYSFQWFVWWWNLIILLFIRVSILKIKIRW